MTTTEAIVAEQPSEDKAGPPMGGGGMGGMGGMDYWSDESWSGIKEICVIFMRDF